MKLTRENTIALIVDLQEKLIPAIHDSARLLEHSIFFLKGLGVYSTQVVHTRQYPKGLGDTLAEIRELPPTALTFDKTTFSCLETAAIRDYFVGDARPNVLLAGIEGHICVQQTAFDLLELGKRVYLICDCVSSRDPYDLQVSIQRMTLSGIIPTTSESALYEIAHAAGSSEFKALGKLARDRKI